MNRTFTFIAIAVSTATCVSSTRLYVQAKIEPTDTIRVAYVRLDGKPLTLGHMEWRVSYEIGYSIDFLKENGDRMCPESLRLYEPNIHFSLDELPFFGCPQLRQHVVKR